MTMAVAVLLGLAGWLALAYWLACRLGRWLRSLDEREAAERAEEEGR